MLFFNQVRENQDRAHERQRAVFAKRAKKGVKTFHLNVGDRVLWRNMRDATRKGGACNPIWKGTYRLGITHLIHLNTMCIPLQVFIMLMATIISIIHK